MTFSAPSSTKPAAILFDFDGTLADTAPDLAAAVNAMRIARNLSPLALDRLRPFASQGARGLLGAGLNIVPDQAGFEAARLEFLARYESAMTRQTQLFEGVSAMLNTLTSRDIRWGIVTNKVGYLAQPIVAHLGLLPQCAALVCGDTTAHPKPHPAPLLHAAQLMALPPEQCWYVGDDLRDIQAGKAAGMPTVAAAYGYCGDALTVQDWQADYLIETPQALVSLLLNLDLAR